MRSACASRWERAAGRVIGLVLREAVLLLAIGLTLGTGLAAWAGQAAASMVYGLTPRDPVTLGGAVVLLAMVALFASYGPAWRAARLQPMERTAGRVNRSLAVAAL